MTIGLPPSPRLAEFDGELSATQLGVCINQPLDFIKVARVVIVATESKCRFHADDVIIGMWNASPNQKIAELLRYCFLSINLTAIHDTGIKNQTCLAFA
ncbi:MAG: hypothetical protein ACPGCN_16755, partial [bacterium]